MKRRQKHIFLAVCACLLALCSLGGTVFATGTPDPFDYGREGSGSNETLDALTLYERLFGTPETQAERTYLDELSTVVLTYNSAIPDSQINTSYNKTDATLDVSLAAYTFTASNGATVSWIPQRARFEDLSENFTQTEEGYSCRFAHLEEYVTGDFEVEIDFAWSVELSADAADALLNDAYRAGLAALEGQLLPYERAHEAYTKEVNAYLAWQAYLEAVAEYEDYLAARDAYRTALEKYQDYLSLYDSYITDYYQEDQKSVAVKNAYNAYVTAYNVYLQKISVCEQLGTADEANDAFLPMSEKYASVISTIEAWQAWEAYQDFKTNHLQEYNNYLTYRAQVEKVKKQLTVLETLFVADSHGWRLYASLMGNTVATVVARKDELITAGCSASDINAAGASTVVLREVMKGYAALRDAEYETDHARTAALHAYYRQHYTTLKEQFSILCTALNSLYDNSLVVAELDKEGKLEHYRQFVGQLYITSTCLDDTQKMQEDWKLGKGGKKTVRDVVEQVHFVTDGIADPSAVTMPETEIPPVEFVEEVEQPTARQPKDTPNAPAAASGLIKPIELTDPSNGTIPPEADEPRDEPTAPEIDPRVRALAEAVRADQLTERSILGKSRTLTLTKTLSRLVSIDNRKVITFLSHDGKTVLDRQIVEYGTTVRYQGENPSCENEREKFEFTQWVLEDRQTPCNMVVDRDMTLYAHGAVSVQHYTVTWVLDGVERTVENIPYGEMPKSPFDLSKTEDDFYTYTFSGWSPEVTAVTGNATYVGSVTKTPKTFTVTWDLGDRTETMQVTYGEIPVYDGTPSRAPDAYAYTFRSWDRSPERVTGDVTYVALYDAAPFAKATDGTVMDALHEDGKLTILCGKNRLDIRAAAEFALANQKTLVLRWSDFSLSMDALGLEVFCASSCRQIRLTDVHEDTYGRVYTVGYCNNVGETMELSVSVTLSANADDEGNERSLFLQQNGAWQEKGNASVSLAGGATVRVTDCYWIDLLRVEHCFPSAIPSHIGAGSLIDLKVNCEFGYEVVGARVTLDDGTVITTDGLTFLMPQGNVSIALVVERIVYHVSFVADGAVISEKDYYLGDKIEIPASPTKPSDGVYDYVFSKWSQEVTLAFGDDRSLVIEAVWSATPVLTYNPYQSGNNNNVFITVVLPIVGGAAVIGVATYLTLRYLKKRKAGALVTAEAVTENADAEDATEEPETEEPETPTDTEST